MFEIILGILAVFGVLVLTGWTITLIRVRMGYVRRGQEAIEEYFNNVGFALLMTGFLVLLSLESWIG